MSKQIGFNHVFLFLMLICALSAFVLPPSISDHARGLIDNLLTPVSSPTRSIVRRIDARLTPAPAPPTDEQGRACSPIDLQEEIEALKFQLANVKWQLDDLKRLNHDLQSMGSLRDACRVIPVSGGDAGTRQTLSLGASSLDGLATGMPVVYPHGFVGQLQIVGLAAARVQLVTDASFVINGRFVRYQRSDSDFVDLKAPSAAVSGDGRGGMYVEKYKMSDVRDAGLTSGDWVVVADRAWPDNVQQTRLGEIVAINPMKKNPLFAEIEIRPRTNLMKLQSVMVVVKR